jgi:hypothetical protein
MDCCAIAAVDCVLSVGDVSCGQQGVGISSSLLCELESEHIIIIIIIIILSVSSFFSRFVLPRTARA